MTDAPSSYLMVSSVLGFYSLRFFEALTPRKDDTTMTTVKTEVRTGIGRGSGGSDPPNPVTTTSPSTHASSSVLLRPPLSSICLCSCCNGGSRPLF